MTVHEAALEKPPDLFSEEVCRHAVLGRCAVGVAEKREHSLANPVAALVRCTDSVGWMLSFHQHLEEQHGKGPVIVGRSAVTVGKSDVKSLGTDVGLACDRASIR